MRSSCHHSSLISYRAHRRARWMPLWVGSLFLIVLATPLVAEKPSAGRDLAAPEGAKAAAAPSDSQVYEVNGATITWNAPREGVAPLTDAQRVQFSAEMLSSLQEAPAKLQADHREIKVETLEDGTRSARIPIELMLYRALTEEVNQTEEER